MRICVCGAQVPFVRGGAELAQENLVRALREAGHEAELVRIPTAWDRARVFDAAMAWRLVPLDADLVIATNFPSYFARHPRKRVWLFHQHRGAYDACDAGWSDFDDGEAALEAQRLLTGWDSVVLGEAERIFTLSDLVSDRLRRFNGLDSEPLYHPPPLHDRLHGGPSGDYVFCPSRLEANKRPELAVEALAHLHGPTRLVLAGKGTRHDELVATARRDRTAGRLTMPGFVSDEELVTLMAGALAVVYAPFEEDYGYVTLQAFLAGKPVVTASDSGGVLEWVEHGVNGLIVDPSPGAIAAAIDELATDPDRARAMGEAGRARVAALSWPDVVSRLLAD